MENFSKKDHIILLELFKKTPTEQKQSYILETIASKDCSFAIQEIFVQFFLNKESFENFEAFLKFLDFSVFEKLFRGILSFFFNEFKSKNENKNFYEKFIVLVLGKVSNCKLNNEDLYFIRQFVYEFPIISFLNITKKYFKLEYFFLKKFVQYLDEDDILVLNSFIKIKNDVNTLFEMLKFDKIRFELEIYDILRKAYFSRIYLIDLHKNEYNSNIDFKNFEKMISKLLEFYHEKFHLSDIPEFIPIKNIKDEDIEDIDKYDISGLFMQKLENNFINFSKNSKVNISLKLLHKNITNIEIKSFIEENFDFIKNEIVEPVQLLHLLNIKPSKRIFSKVLGLKSEKIDFFILCKFIVKNKLIQRSDLKILFEELLYFDTKEEFRCMIFEIIGEILEDYKDMDQEIKTKIKKDYAINTKKILEIPKREKDKENYLLSHFNKSKVNKRLVKENSDTNKDNVYCLSAQIWPEIKYPTQDSLYFILNLLKKIVKLTEGFYSERINFIIPEILRLNKKRLIVYEERYDSLGEFFEIIMENCKIENKNFCLIFDFLCKMEMHKYLKSLHKFDKKLFENYAKSILSDKKTILNVKTVEEISLFL